VVKGFEHAWGELLIVNVTTFMNCDTRVFVTATDSSPNTTLRAQRPIMSSANMTIFRAYAQKSNPASLPPSVLLSHSETCLTVFDGFPKSIFHFLVIPRVRPPFNVYQLANLRSLLKCEKKNAKELFTDLNREANDIKIMIESEMLKKYGFKWEIWMGFHAVPSME